MDDSPEVIRQQMEETRASLSEKLETLEQQVTGTVQDARNAVTDTVQCVKDAFDLKLQTQRHPWAVLGGSVVVGVVTVSLLERLAPMPRPPKSPREIGPQGWPTMTGGAVAEHPLGEAPKEEQPKAETGEPDWLHSLAREFEPEIAKLKGLAVGVAMSVVREMLAQSVPEPIQPQLTDVMDDITIKLGGEPIRGSLLQNGHAHSSSQGDSNEERYETEMGRSLGPTQGTSQETLGRHNGR
ncbi:MAG TPA: hypothetical protein VGZ47_07975 [Gemmataceae bacterium]|jgi:hypothetical protein|nr:hypothetical protein [Gemmataceae bacterium]